MRPFCSSRILLANSCLNDVVVDMKFLKKLRFDTEAPIKDCHEALRQSDNDIKTAMEWLRNKGFNRALGKSERVTEQGVIITSVHNCVEKPSAGFALAFQLCCETSFSAGNSRFIALAGEIAEIAAKFSSENPQVLVDSAAAKKAAGGSPFEDPLLIEVAKRSADNIASCVHVTGENIILNKAFQIPFYNTNPESCDVLNSEEIDDLIRRPKVFGSYAHSCVVTPSKHVGRTVSLVSCGWRNDEHINPAISIDDLAQHCVANAGNTREELVKQTFTGEECTVSAWLKRQNLRFISSAVIEFGQEPIIAFPSKIQDHKSPKSAEIKPNES
eukprot:Tbor_TRINITY_DN2778_c0_g1::TRINITY_DN2778_c0_g1_i1::g.15204::m.15204/K02357/tsf, TSFM; elongation factor Ts